MFWWESSGLTDRELAYSTEAICFHRWDAWNKRFDDILKENEQIFVWFKRYIVENSCPLLNLSICTPIRTATDPLGTSLSSATTDTHTVVHLGKRNDQESGYLGGAFDDVAIWIYTIDFEDDDELSQLLGELGLDDLCKDCFTFLIILPHVHCILLFGSWSSIV